MPLLVSRIELIATNYVQTGLERCCEFVLLNVKTVSAALSAEGAPELYSAHVLDFHVSAHR